MLGDKPYGSGDETPTSRWYVVVPILLAAATLLITAGGWVWAMSAKSYAVEEVTRRVSTLEARRDTSDKENGDIVSRLSRIEGKIEIMLSHIGK